MSMQPTYFERTGTVSTWAALVLRREFWGGVTLVTMWLAVLFVGIFGGNIQTSDAGGSSSSIPVVVVVVVAALIATISVGRWAFGPARRDP